MQRKVMLDAALEALRAGCRRLSPLVVEHDWGHYLVYCAPQIFVFLWPQATHITVGLLEGARLRSSSQRLLGRGPALRTLIVRQASDVDDELIEFLRQAADLASL